MSGTNETNTGIDVRFTGGPCKELVGHRMALAHGSLTRIEADGPFGQSLILEMLADSSLSITRSLASFRWPTMADRLKHGVEVHRMSPCDLADQDRFFVMDPRNLMGLFGLEELVSEFLESGRCDPGCRVCGSPMRVLSLPDLSASLAGGLEGGELLMISAPLASPGPRLRKKWMSLGFHRFWLGDHLADSEDIDVSGSWSDVRAVLIDSVRLGDGVTDRLIEAVMTARSMGSDYFLLHQGERSWSIDPGDLFCPVCLTTAQIDQTVVAPLPDPTIADLAVWVVSEKKTEPDTETGQAEKIPALLQRFQYGGLKASTRLSDLPWADQGLLLLLKATINRGPGRFILADAPFLGLEENRIASLIEYIKESRREGAAWVVAADGGHLHGYADMVLLLEGDKPQPITSVKENREPVCPGLEPWQGLLSQAGGPRREIHSGQRLEWPETDGPPGRLNTRGWTFVAASDAFQREPMVRIAGHGQAWKMSQGRHQTLAGVMGWDRLIADRMAQLPQSRARGLDANRLLGRHPLGQCISCRGRGMEAGREDGRWSETCSLCQGTGMRRAPGAPEYHHLTLYDIMRLTVRELDERITFSTRLRCGTRAAMRLGFEFTELNRRLWTFSHSERWLLLLLSQMVQFAHRGLWIIEQPWLGLNALQARSLDELYRCFVSRGGTLVTLGSQRG